MNSSESERRAHHITKIRAALEALASCAIRVYRRNPTERFRQQLIDTLHLPLRACDNARDFPH
jgi:hypothetical protein